MNTTIETEIMDWDVVDKLEFVEIKENYIDLEEKKEDKNIDLEEKKEDKNIEEEKNITQKIFTEWKDLTKQNKCKSVKNPDNVVELVTSTDSELSYIVEKEEPKNLNDIIITEVDNIIKELKENDELCGKQTNITDDTSQIKTVTNRANGDVVITFNEDTSKLKNRINKRNIRKNKKKNRRQRGKEIFMMIKIDQWAAVHPESLDSEIEMINVRKLFEFIWEEMHESEKYAYFKYRSIDEKYKTAKTNNLFKKIYNFFDNIIDNIGFFFENLICLHDEDEKRALQSKQNFKNSCRNLKD